MSPISRRERNETKLEVSETSEPADTETMCGKYEDYLEGMGTFSGPAPLSVAALYEAYLEGMETPAST